jgi:hypothetical protein
LSDGLLGLCISLNCWSIQEDLGNRPFHHIQKKAKRVMSSERIISFVNYAQKHQVDRLKYEGEYHVTHYRFIIKNIRPVFQRLLLEGQLTDQDLLKAVNFIKEMHSKNLSLSQYPPKTWPTTFIPSRIKLYLMEFDAATQKTRFNPYKYEFFIYQQLKNKIEATHIYANDTTQYKNFDADLEVSKSGNDIRHVLQDTKLHQPRVIFYMMYYLMSVLILRLIGYLLIQQDLIK